MGLYGDSETPVGGFVRDSETPARWVYMALQVRYTHINPRIQSLNPATIYIDAAAVACPLNPIHGGYRQG